ncbi:unnamed protein product [Nezara viridula]|uniref:Uncharacterized protein n=1 Tax=Nezara viridula TaxID=85310 RepID=A0A9P0MTI2_NEZVI|nr:unnamed protein product [Nezara viridula]
MTRELEIHCGGIGANWWMRAMRALDGWDLLAPPRLLIGYLNGFVMCSLLAAHGRAAPVIAYCSRSFSAFSVVSIES